MGSELSEKDIDAVLNALSNSNFKWRTIGGVAQETGLQTDVVRHAIAEAADKIVRSALPSADGKDLFTTRERFQSVASFSEKLLGAIKNRAV